MAGGTGPAKGKGGKGPKAPGTPLTVPDGPDAEPRAGSGLLVKLGRIAGIAGISVGVLFLLFSQFIRQTFFPTLGPDQAYNLLLLFMLFTFAIAAAGLAVWASQSGSGGPRVVVLVLAFALVMSGIGAYVISGAKQTEKKTAESDGPPLVPDSLREQALKDARDAFAATRMRFEIGIAPATELIRAHQNLVEAEIAVSRTREERAAAYQSEIAVAKSLERDAQQRIDIGVLAPSELSAFRSHRSGLEVALAKEQPAGGIVALPAPAVPSPAQSGEAPHFAH